MRSKVILAEQEVDPHCAGMELGVYARQHLGISNRRLQKAVRTRGLLLNGRPAHSKRKLRPGDRVQVALPAKEQVKIPVADPKNLKVLYEDPWLLAVDKPAGLPSYSLQDARGAANQVAGHFPRAGAAAHSPPTTSFGYPPPRGFWSLPKMLRPRPPSPPFGMKARCSAATTPSARDAWKQPRKSRNAWTARRP